jgi:hypothetical protein
MYASYYYMCVVGNPLIVIFEHIMFASYMLDVSCSSIYLDSKEHFHHF